MHLNYVQRTIERKFFFFVERFIIFGIEIKKKKAFHLNRFVDFTLSSQVDFVFIYVVFDKSVMFFSIFSFFVYFYFSIQFQQKIDKYRNTFSFYFFIIYTYPAIPLDSILFASSTSFEYTSYCHCLCPRIPANTAPVWIPTRMSTGELVFC